MVYKYRKFDSAKCLKARGWKGEGYPLNDSKPGIVRPVIAARPWRRREGLGTQDPITKRFAPDFGSVYARQSDETVGSTNREPFLSARIH